MQCLLLRYSLLLLLNTRFRNVVTTRTITSFSVSVADLYPHHSAMSQQLVANPSRLPSSIASGSPYSFATASAYHPASLLPSSSAVTPMSHQVSPVPSASSTFQAGGHHQLPPTPNSLVTMMGPNSGNSNSVPDQLNAPELPINPTVSPVQQQQQQHQQQQQQQQQTSQENVTTPWNAPITSGARMNLPSPPMSLQQPHAYNAHQAHQAFASSYSAQGFQQQPRTTSAYWF